MRDKILNEYMVKKMRPSLTDREKLTAATSGLEDDGYRSGGSLERLTSAGDS